MLRQLLAMTEVYGEGKCNHNVKIKFPQDESRNNLIHIITKGI